MDYKTATTPRFAEFRPDDSGKLKVEWRLSDTTLIDAVRLTLPPARAIPIIFVPGIMGSNLCDSHNNKPVWLLNGVKDIPANLALSWSRKDAGARQKILHPQRTRVYKGGAVPKDGSAPALTQQDFLKRGWGEISEASYHKFLLWLNDKMNGDRNPANWEGFSSPSLAANPTEAEKLTRKLSPDLLMKMDGLPDIAESGHMVDPVRSDDLLKRSKAFFPIYGFGYNWLASNKEAAESLRKRIESVISENNVGQITCKQVILVTHSMGGLVARACSQLPEMSQKIVGIVHGVMPATGAAVAYRRCKVGMKDEDAVAGLVIGSDGQEVTAVFAQAPGALQLLPSEAYGTKWLKFSDQTGKLIKSLPLADPYDEIYLEKDKWWGLVKEEWLSPKEGMTFSWHSFEKNIAIAKDFHRRIANKYHHNTYVFYGGGAERGSFGEICWGLKKGVAPEPGGNGPSAEDVPSLLHRDVRTDGSNNLYVGGEDLVYTSNRGDASIAKVTKTSFWEIRCSKQDSAGDGTVPVSSGRDPRKSGGRNILQQFELPRIQHEPAYRDYATTKLVTYYAVTKLAAMADLP